MAVNVQMSELTNDLPREVMGLIGGSSPGVERAAGVFTKEDVIKIKQYVKKSLALPSELPEVKLFLGYEAVNIAGLEPSDIKVLFEKIKFHASSWDAVESKIIQQSINLGSAAQSILSSGNSIISDIKEMPILERVRSSLGDLTNAELEGIKYTSEDGEIASAVGEIIKLMKVDINAQQTATRELKDSISKFKIELSGGELSTGERVDGLQPDLIGKYDLMEQNSFIKSIADNNEIIAEKKAKIVQLDKDYDQYVKNAIAGIAGGLIGLAITGGIFGAKAENAKKERNVLKEEVDSLESFVAGQENLQHALDRNKSDFLDLNNRMLGAEAALNILNTMWQNMLTKIDGSAAQFERIDDALKLTSFVAQFKLVINPWQDVKDTSGTLVEVFNEALEEYKKSFN
ncbi:alpha-xenorhabdolysin family binary toxin subunit A [Pseudomonas sp. MF6772]|uniref:alpha-xenorhabdolysin family binary toxin subunit A n=1 Tax=Pseudomonas TaxID=286 RepID=UPI001473EAD4|nr:MULTISPECIES: alpha-xenorhabdolysin family binary toxin subunit A [Pseudomonas]MBJ2270084.1 alpha-xenorhabdolysin family binary toxin subunit A [Pseudomonas sp. MF6772]MCU0211705.1 alpha-xenorhabdolysin family binary toxin subunit A [Pseudomonas shahriarae]MDD0980444.1 alpha-xenorhabdolysin family binary toxin subunit A [Pseudomonas shahriarae]NMY23170.1 alpha-xenorhabdolysin family binary toxin subunit A [Pseudomonas sp. WS 5410]